MQYNPIFFCTSHPKYGEYINPLAHVILCNQDLIITWKSGSLFFFIHISVLLNSRDFLECILILISSSLIFTKVFAYVIAFTNNSFEIEQKKFSTSNCIKIHFSLFFTFLNQLITVLVSCRSFTDDKSLSLLFSCSRKYLLIYPISLFAGSIKQHSRFELKFGSWSSKGRNAFDLSRQSTPSETP